MMYCLAHARGQSWLTCVLSRFMSQLSGYACPLRILARSLSPGAALGSQPLTIQCRVATLRSQATLIACHLLSDCAAVMYCT